MGLVTERAADPYWCFFYGMYACSVLLQDLLSGQINLTKFTRVPRVRNLLKVREINASLLKN